MFKLCEGEVAVFCDEFLAFFAEEEIDEELGVAGGLAVGEEVEWAAEGVGAVDDVFRIGSDGGAVFELYAEGENGFSVYP